MDQKLIIENARKAAKGIKQRRNEFSQEEFLHTRISTVPFWKRISVICFGLLTAVLSVWIFVDGRNPVWAIIFGIAGFIILFFGVFGGRKNLDSILNGLDASVSGNIIDSIIDGIF